MNKKRKEFYNNTRAATIYEVLNKRDPYSEEYLKEYEQYVEKAAEKVWNMQDSKLIAELRHLLRSFYHSYENIQSARDPIKMIKEEYRL